VELHGGHIGCNSKLGQGTEFYFTVDCPVKHASTNSPGVSAAASAATPSSQLFQLDATPVMMLRKLAAEETGQRVTSLRSIQVPKPSSRMTLASKIQLADALSDHTLRSVDGCAIGSMEASNKPPMQIANETPAANVQLEQDGSLVRMQTVNLRGSVISMSTPSAVRVLIAEDHAPTSRLMRLVLTKLGCEVTAVENGQIAVDACTRSSSSSAPDDTPKNFENRAACLQQFHLIFMDGNMPVLGGFWF